MIVEILEGCALLSAALSLWQWNAAVRFPLHARLPVSPDAPRPGITVFKPLKGADDKTVECLRSWLAQDYRGPVQFLFGVKSAQDRSCEVVRALIAEFPGADSQLLICPETVGPNAKVSSLAQMAGHAKHGWFLVSDSDVWAPPDLLSQLMAVSKSGGLVTCLYRLAGAETAAMRWETTAANADFWSQVLQSRDLRLVDFALGAVMMLQQNTLEQIGGFRSIAHFLADDYQLGHRVAHAGGEVVLSRVVVECRGGPGAWRDVWKHQMRWARTIRICKPLPFFLSILGNATLWPLLWLAGSRSAVAATAAVVMLLLRAVSGIHIESLILQSPPRWTESWRIGFKDLMQFAVWAAAFVGRTVEWRGQRYTVNRDGSIEPLLKASM